jgi:hypothetical protein
VKAVISASGFGIHDPAEGIPALAYSRTLRTRST